MLFEKRFKVVEIRESGTTATWWLKGKSKDVKKDIENIKQQSKRYEMFGQEGMIVWV